jgi:hypothetical protein
MLEDIDIRDNILDKYIKNKKIKVNHKDENGKNQLLTLRPVAYYDNEKNHILEFLTIITEMTAEQVGFLYKIW